MNSDINKAALENKESKKVSTDSISDNKAEVIKKLFAQSKLAKDPFSKDWNKRFEYYKGKQHKGVAKQPVVNICRTTIQTILPLLTDAKPGISVLPSEPNDLQFAQAMQDLIDAWWNKSGVDMNHTLLEPLMDMFIYDAGILKVYWDNEADNGLGDVRVKSIKPQNIFINKEATDFDKDCFYVIERQYLSTAWLKKKFPEFADRIKSDSDTSAEDVATIDSYSEQEPIDQKQENDSSGYNISDKDSRETTEVWEVWIDSDELEYYEELSSNGGTETGQKLKYPQGKLITFLPNQNVILQEVNNPYEHGNKPYIRFVDTLLPHSFWGEGEIEPLIGAQDNANMVLTNILKYLKLMSNPIWFTTSDSGVRREDITNDVALVLELDPGKMGSVRRDIPPAMQAGITELYATMLRNGDIESGVSEVTAGRRMTGIQSGDAIDSLQEANHTRIRLKERNMQVSLSQMGSQLVSLFLQFYTVPRMARVTGNEGNPSFVEYFIDKTETGYIFNKKNLDFNEEQNDYVTDGYIASKESKGKFDIRIVSGTSLPFAKKEKANLAMRLAQMGAINKESLLKSIEFPEWEKIIADEAAAKKEKPQPQPQPQQPQNL